jgi:hypothetical protein
MISLGTLPEFRKTILIAPALSASDGYEWGNTDSVHGLEALVDSVATKYPVDRKAIYLLGYSAGASRVLTVAHHLSGKLAGIVAVAGDILRPVRDQMDSAVEFASIPILLVCMINDDGAHTRCALNEENLAILSRRGLRRISLERLGGDHNLQFPALAPVVERWLSTAPRP